jgi:hypothetical protein
VHGAVSYIQDFSVPACSTAVSSGRPPSVQHSSRWTNLPSPIFPVFASSASRASSPWSRMTMGGATCLARARRQVDRVARAAGPRPPRALPARGCDRARSGNCEPRPLGPRERRRRDGRGARGRAGVRTDGNGGDVFLAVPEPCVPGALLCRRGRSRRRRHDLDLVAGQLRHAGHPVTRVRPRPRQGARRVHRRIRLVRYQRCGPRRRGRRAFVEDHRQAGARAVVTAGRAWLGSERAAAVTRPESRARRGRATRRLGHADVDSRPPAAARGSCLRRNRPA